MSAPDQASNAGHFSIIFSIRFRIAILFSSILAVILIIFGTIVFISQQQGLFSQSMTSLLMQQHEIQTGVLPATEESEDPVQSTPGSNLQLQKDEIAIFVDSSGKILNLIGPLDQNIARTLTVENKSRSFTYDIPTTRDGILTHQQYLFSRENSAHDASPTGAIILGIPLDAGGFLPRLKLTLILVGLGAVLISMIGGYWLAGRSLKPVKTITHTARQIGESDLSKRIELGTRDELGELASTFNDMLARLEASFARQKQFTADASHELRTPLTIMGLEAERGLEKERTLGEYQKILNTIRSENRFMSHLVEELLTLARMDSGKFNMDLRPVDLSDIALEAYERFTSLAEKKGVKLILGSLEHGVLQGDKQSLLQMASNLLDNSIKYSVGSLDPSVSISTLVEPTGKPKETLLVIQDTGPGIPPEHLPHLFDRFYQVDPSRTRPKNPEDTDLVSGTGLGLAIVDGIVKLHYGKIDIQSQMGVGTNFIVRFPLLDQK